MTRKTRDEEDFDEEWEDSEDFDDNDTDDADATIECPYCGREVHEDSPRCPYCENYLSREELPRDQKPWWIIVGAALGLLVFLRWLFL